MVTTVTYKEIRSKEIHQGDMPTSVRRSGCSMTSDGKTGRRSWKTTSDGVNRRFGGGVWGVGSARSCRRRKGIGIVHWSSSSLLVGWARGLERSDVFRRRTGPGPEDSSSLVPSRERSAMSQGLVVSGSMERAEIQGRSSKDVRGLEKVLIQQSDRAQWR